MIQNINKPTNPNIVKLLTLLTFLTVFFPQWFDSIPLENVTEETKELIHWAFKGLDIVVAVIALFTDEKLAKTYIKGLR
jgi:hypothetical protein